MARRKRRWWRMGASVVLLGLALMMCAAGLLVFTASGRRALADGLEALVSSQIPGRLQIGELTQVGWLFVRAKDVRFFHPGGRCVLHVSRAIVEPDLSNAWHRQLGFRRVVADGGSMLFSIDPDGRLSFEATVSAPRRPGEPSDLKAGLHYDLRFMHVEHFTLLLQLSGDEHYRMSEVMGVVHVRRIGSVGTRVVLQDISGSITPEVAGEKIAVRRLGGEIAGSSERVADLRARLAVNQDSVLSLRVVYEPHQQDKLKLHVLDKVGTQAAALTWLMHAAAGLSGSVSVEG